MGRLTAIVLGAAAGGGYPQWNCRCDVCRLAWDGDPRVRARTQASLAVSADGAHWTLFNASPDLRAQLAATPALHPRELRGSPIEAVVLTGGEIDQTAGLLNLRERQPFTLMATEQTHAALAANPMFGALAPDVVTRRAIAPGTPFLLPGGLSAELFMVPGKVPLYLEQGTPETSVESGANVGVEIKADDATLMFVPGAAAVTRALARAAVACGRHPVRRHAVHRRRDDRVRARARKPGGAWATCRSTAPTARSPRCRTLASAAFTSTSTTPIRS